MVWLDVACSPKDRRFRECRITSEGPGLRLHGTGVTPCTIQQLVFRLSLLSLIPSTLEDLTALSRLCLRADVRWRAEQMDDKMRRQGLGCLVCEVARCETLCKPKASW